LRLTQDPFFQKLAIMKSIAMMLAVTLLAGGSGSARAGETLYTNVYVVPEDFQTVEAPSSQQDAVKAGETDGDKFIRLGKRTAIDILTSAGIDFPEGASAIYIPNTSKLIVRNTEEQMKLVDAFMDWVRMP
jgi:hypothetical protein